MIQDLITISRSSQNNAYLSHKQSLPGEILDIHVTNNTNNYGDRWMIDKGEKRRKVKANVLCTSNSSLELRTLIDEDTKRQNQKLL